MNIEKNQIDTTIIKLLLSRWGIKASQIADEIEMPVSTFKLKLSDTQPLYAFTALEYIKVLGALNRMAADITKVANKELRAVNKKVNTSKK